MGRSEFLDWAAFFEIEAEDEKDAYAQAKQQQQSHNAGQKRMTFGG